MRKLTDIEIALCADGQRPYITEIKMFPKGGAKTIHGFIYHKTNRSRAEWDAQTGDCKVNGISQPNYKLIFEKR